MKPIAIIIIRLLAMLGWLIVSYLVFIGSGNLIFFLFPLLPAEFVYMHILACVIFTFMGLVGIGKFRE